jgi:uncharacterized protein YbjT (DUF2867 family)
LRVLVTGATGLIGAAIVAGLIEQGHEVLGVARHVTAARRRLPQCRWIALDIATATTPEIWLPNLANIDAVVNSAGVLQDSFRDSVKGVHEDGAKALFAACERAGVRRLVQISAIGVDRKTPTRFTATKLSADIALMEHDLDWIILRPSVVVGRAAFGGSALIRGLAALPVLPVLADTGPLQIVQLGDLVKAVLYFLSPEAPSRLALDVAGPERLSFVEVVRHYRRWLGWREAWLWYAPKWLEAILYGLGDSAGWLGWRPPIGTTARREIVRGAVGDAGRWTRITGISPRSLSQALTAEPASVQERWFAGLYLLKPLLFAVLALFWIATALICLVPGYRSGVALMQEAGAGFLAAPTVIAGALADLAIGIAIAFRPTSRPGLYAAMAITIIYLILATALLPHLWFDPLGVLLKALPILVLHGVALGILEER